MKKIAAALLALFILSFLSTLASSDEAGRIHFINVGEGDSILLEIEGRSALIDTGNLISGPHLVKYLKGKGIEKLDYLIITHPHPDHMGGVFFILPALKVEKIHRQMPQVTDVDTKAFPSSGKPSCISHTCPAARTPCAPSCKPLP